ncbi:MAG: ATP-binding cassette domain-containing protein [Candidatus Izemoplasmatales bacterium]
MAQIVNKILTNIYDFLLKYQESKLTFKKELLIIKKDEFETKEKHKIDKINLKFKHKLSKLETQAGIESDYLKEKISEKIHELEEKVYWKERIINQKIKRAKDEKKIEKLQADLSSLEHHKTKKIAEIKDKLINLNPSQEDIKAYEDQKALLEKEKADKIKNIKETYEEKTKQLETKTQESVNKYKEKINTYSNKLMHLEETLKAHADTVILDNDIALSLRNLSMHFGGLKAVDNLSFDVKKGEIFGLIGPNGAGKTTVFNCITRFYKPTSGDMYFNNINQKTIHLNEVKVHNIIKQGIVRTFQNVELVWELNILDNLLVAAHSAYRSNFFGHSVHSRLTKREETIFTKRAMKILDDLDLTSYTYSFPIGLPYGVLKKVELARTLMSNPKLIILDEPAAGLNDAETKELAKFIRKIKDEYKVTIFLVEHDMGLVMNICDTVCAISFGKKLEIGTPKEVQKSKVVQEAYLGGD